MEETPRIYQSWGFMWPSSEEAARIIVQAPPKPGVFTRASDKVLVSAELAEDERYALFWADVFACFFPDYWY